MTESEAKGFVQGKLDCMKKCDIFNKEDKHRNNECELCEYCYSQGNFGEQKEAFQMAINALEKQIPKKVDKTEIEISKRKFATELKQLVRQRCAEINHYVSGCNSPFSYLQIADVQESLREIENTLNIKIKE